MTTVMFHVDSTLCGVSFEGFFGLYGFVTASGSVYVHITKARIMINEDCCRFEASSRELILYIRLFLSNKSRD